MVINSGVLEQKINQYFDNKINKDNLGLWAMEAYYALMKGEYIDIDKLPLYHFLRKLSTFHIVPDDMADEYPCSEKEVLEIRDVLCGKKDIHYTFNIKIYKNIYQKEPYRWKMDGLQRLRELIDKICVNDVSSAIMYQLMNYVNQETGEIHTLIDLFEMNIKDMIAENIDFDEEILDFRQSVGIYTGGSEANKKVFVPDLKRVLECVMGEKQFRISVIYKKGLPYLSMIL